MDRKRIDNLLQAIAELDKEIGKGLQKPLLDARGADWQVIITRLQGECEATIEKLREAENKLGELTGKAIRTLDAAKRIYSIRKEIAGQTAPTTLAQSIGAIVENLFALGNNMIRVDAVQDQMVNNGVILGVRNPAAVIASILARDKRLEKVEKGKFRKKTPNDLGRETMPKS